MAVRQNGLAIEFINSPSEAIQLAAIRENGYAIARIDNPSEAVQLEAVRQNGWAIRYVSKGGQIHIIKKLLSEGHKFSEDFINDYEDLYEKAKMELEVESSLEKDFE
jgi:hypothetical protein